MAGYTGRRARRRARGGASKRADGGRTGDNTDSPTGDRDLGNGMGQIEGSMRPMEHMREPPPPPDEKVPVRHEKRGGGIHRARGGRAPSDGPRIHDARDDAQETGQDGRDKVSQRSGTAERAVEMEDARARGGRLTAAERHKMPSSEFALPGRGEGPGGKGAGSYPINDASHARNALARVSQHGSPEEKKRVRAAVHRKFPDIGRQ